MPGRMNKRTWNRRYGLLVQRDGERCGHCGKAPPEVRLEIDHINGDPRDHRLENLRLLCTKCNRADGNRRRARRRRRAYSDGTSEYAPPSGGASSSAPSSAERKPWEKKRIDTPPSAYGGREGEGASGGAAPLDQGRTRENATAIDPSDASAEFAANRRYEGPFRDYVLYLVHQEQLIPKQELINAGAEHVGCVPKTAASYLDKLTSRAGPLEEIRSPSGTFVQFKADGRPR